MTGFRRKSGKQVVYRARTCCTMAAWLIQALFLGLWLSEGTHPWYKSDKPCLLGVDGIYSLVYCSRLAPRTIDLWLCAINSLQTWFIYYITYTFRGLWCVEDKHRWYTRWNVNYFWYLICIQKLLGDVIASCIEGFVQQEIKTHTGDHQSISRKENLKQKVASKLDLSSSHEISPCTTYLIYMSTANKRIVGGGGSFQRRRKSISSLIRETKKCQLLVRTSKFSINK